MGQEQSKAVKALTDSLRDGEQAGATPQPDKAADAGDAVAWEQQGAGLPAWELASVRAAQGWVIGQPVTPADFTAALESVRNEVIQ